MNKKIGFIGAGKLGGAIIGGLLKTDITTTETLNVYEINEEISQKIKEKYNPTMKSSIEELVIDSDIIVLAIKPFVVEGVLNQIKDLIKDKLIISIAAGVTTKSIEDVIGEKPVIRVLTNTPSFILEGMSIIAVGQYAKEEDIKTTEEIFNAIGKTSIAEEHLMDVATAISGSGPAFFYEIANGFAKSCEKLGYKKEEAIKIAAQTMLGSAKMMLNTPKTPEELVKEVTTPGGCTIVGLEVMNSNNIENILDETLVKTTEKASILAKG